MEDCDHLTMSDADSNVLQNLSKMGAHLKALRLKMLETEALAEQAKKEYDYYASSVLPMEMFSAGVSELTLLDGGKLILQSKYYCTPNKNDADKQVMAAWLRGHGGEHLVKEKATVEKAFIDKLKEAGVPYTEIDDINTNSLKAFLKDKIGASGGMAEVQLQDIPACMHFQEQQLVTIEV